jgi:hypothetical protein
LHELSASGVLAGGLGNGFVVFLNAFIEPVGVSQQVADTAVGTTGECFEMGADSTEELDSVIDRFRAFKGVVETFSTIMLSTKLDRPD